MIPAYEDGLPDPNPRSTCSSRPLQLPLHAANEPVRQAVDKTWRALWLENEY